jgi:hypothetical protein
MAEPQLGERPQQSLRPELTIEPHGPGSRELQWQCVRPALPGERARSPSHLLAGGRATGGESGETRELEPQRPDSGILCRHANELGTHAHAGRAIRLRGGGTSPPPETTRPFGPPAGGESPPALARAALALSVEVGRSPVAVRYRTGGGR